MCIVKFDNFGFSLKLLWLYVNLKNAILHLYPLPFFLNHEGFSQHKYWRGKKKKSCK